MMHVVVIYDANYKLASLKNEGKNNYIRKGLVHKRSNIREKCQVDDDILST